MRAQTRLWIAAPRKRAALLACGAMVLFSTLAAAVSWSSWHRHIRAAAVAFDKTVHDFGRVAPGAPLECEFRYTNAADAPIKIANITSSCGCVATLENHLWLAPGASDSIPVRLSTAGLVPPRQVRRSIVVSFENDAPARQVLELTADLRPDVRVEPSTVVFPAMGAGAVQTITVERDLLPPESFVHATLVPTAPYYAIVERDRQQDRVVFEVALARDKAPPLPRALAVRWTAHDSPRQLSVPVEYRREQGPTTLVPGMYFKSVSRSEAIADPPAATRREFALRTAAEARAHIARVEPRSERETGLLAWELEKATHPTQLALWFRALPDTPLFFGSITVFYEDDAGAPIGQGDVDVRLFVRAETPRSNDAIAEP